jgi:outer membrane receptor protein involved in Fe transport
LDVHARLSFAEYIFRGRYVYDYGDEEPDIQLAYDDGRDPWLGGALHLDWHPVPYNRLLAGFDGRYHFDAYQTYYDDFKVYLDDARTQVRGAAFIENTVIPWDWLRLKIGGRLDWYSTHGTSFSPRGAVVARLAEGSWLKAVLGSAFRAPTFYELYYQDGGNTQISNPDLAHERFTSAELIYEQTIGRGLSLLGSAFENRARRLTGLEPTEDVGSAGTKLLQVQNTGEIRTLGAELRATLHLPDARGYANYSFQRAHGGQHHISNSPYHLAGSGVVVQLLDERLLTAADVLYVDSRRTTSGASSGPSLRVNLHGTWRTPLDGLSVQADVFDLLDRGDRDVTGPEIAGELAAREGIAAWLGLRYQH